MVGSSRCCWWATSRWRNRRSSCPRSLRSPCGCSRRSGSESGYFQVAESQVIGGLQVVCGESVSPGSRVTSRSRCPRSCVFSIWCRVVFQVLGDRITSRLRNPRSCQISSQVVSRYFQVAESKVATSQVIVGPFQIRSELHPGGLFECDAVPGHGDFLSRGRRERVPGSCASGARNGRG